MCKVLADLLGIDDPLFSVGIHQLEQASGQPGADLRLYSEIVRKSHQKIRELGLDPSDSTAEEIYHALFALIQKHDAFLARKLGVKDATDTVDVLRAMQSLVDKLDAPKSAWVLKPTVAKRLLKATPPKKVMKQLGYRSVDSMLKRENIAELFVALRFTETTEWLRAFTKKYKRLKPSEFETRDIEVLHIDFDKWGQPVRTYVEKSHHNVTHMKEMGVIALLPLPVQYMPGVSLAVLPLLLHYMNEIRVYSTLFKIQQVQADFGDILVQTILHDPANHLKVAGHDLHWRSVHRHFGKQGTKDYPEVFEPHVQPEDLFWRKAEEVLYRIEPALHFWHEMDFVAASKGGKIVSFNLMDMAVSYVNQLKFEQRSLVHFRASLWNEIFARYIGQPAVEYQVIKQLSADNPEPAFNDSILEELFI
jgi:hypothetical protein